MKKLILFCLGCSCVVGMDPTTRPLTESERQELFQIAREKTAYEAQRAKDEAERLRLERIRSAGAESRERDMRRLGEIDREIEALRQNKVYIPVKTRYGRESPEGRAEYAQEKLHRIRKLEVEKKELKAKLGIK